MIEGDNGAPGGAEGDRNRAVFSLRRWSQRKHEAARGVRDDAPAPAQGPLAGPSPGSSPGTTVGAAAVAPPAAEPAAPAPVAAAPVVAAPAAQPASVSGTSALPSIDSLTADSDFAPFMRPGVDPELRREALKKLLHDLRFNVMDGLDVYIDDYTKTKPIDPSLARKLLARLRPGSLAGDEELAAAPVAEAGAAELHASEPIDAGAGETTGGADPVPAGADARGDAGGSQMLHSERES